jgi:hypothetical protein
MSRSKQRERNFRELFAGALQGITGDKVTADAGLTSEELDECESRLGLKLPIALRHYYETVGKLPINYEHNRLRLPAKLDMLNGKLVFMEENQLVVFWGVEPGQADPEVFQANNQDPIDWYSEKMTFSTWIITMLRWETGIGEAPRD